jgi:Protein of unknown function (DUF4058)
MPSPFPGMDPYIESLNRWADFHNDFLVGCRAQLNERLPENYVATLDERIELVDEEDLHLTAKMVEPDVAVVHDPETSAEELQAARSAAAVATLEAHTLPQSVELLDFPKQVYVQITRLPDRKVITDIELLSPSNKRRGSEDRVAYLAKRKTLMVHRVNLVEIDLLLAGDRLPMLAPLPRGDFYTFITRAQDFHNCSVYGWSIRDVLPTIPIPLKAEDGAVPLDLAAAFARTYDQGRYGRVLSYSESPALLNESDRAWAADKVAGRRKPAQ